MIRNSDYNSTTIARHTDVKSNNDLKAHIESTWPADGSMSWSNYGKIDVPNTWNIGHRIACKMYDSSNPEDLSRCFSKANLFAQWSVENTSLGVKLPSSEILAWLVSLKLEPVSWGGRVPEPDERAELERVARGRV